MHAMRPNNRKTQDTPPSFIPRLEHSFAANPSYRISFLFFSRSDSTDSLRILTSRCYACAVYAMALCPCLSVCVCVCQVSVLIKRLNTGSHKQHHAMAQDSSFLTPKISAKFDRGHPLLGRRMQVGLVENGDFRQITGFISKTVQDTV